MLLANDDKHDFSRGFDRRGACLDVLAPLQPSLPGTNNMPNTVKRPLLSTPHQACPFIVYIVGGLCPCSDEEHYTRSLLHAFLKLWFEVCEVALLFDVPMQNRSCSPTADMTGLVESFVVPTCAEYPPNVGARNLPDL